jgi:hypothetical protein
MQFPLILVVVSLLVASAGALQREALPAPIPVLEDAEAPLAPVLEGTEVVFDRDAYPSVLVRARNGQLCWIEFHRQPNHQIIGGGAYRLSIRQGDGPRMLLWQGDSSVGASRHLSAAQSATGSWSVVASCNSGSGPPNWLQLWIDLSPQEWPDDSKPGALYFGPEPYWAKPRKPLGGAALTVGTLRVESSGIELRCRSNEAPQGSVETLEGSLSCTDLAGPQLAWFGGELHLVAVCNRVTEWIDPHGSPWNADFTLPRDGLVWHGVVGSLETQDDLPLVGSLPVLGFDPRIERTESGLLMTYRTGDLPHRYDSRELSPLRFMRLEGATWKPFMTESHATVAEGYDLQCWEGGGAVVTWALHEAEPTIRPRAASPISADYWTEYQPNFSDLRILRFDDAGELTETQWPWHHAADPDELAGITWQNLRRLSADWLTADNARVTAINRPVREEPPAEEEQ